MKTPIILTEQQTQALCDAIASGQSVRSSAHLAGISEPTVYRMMARDAEFASKIAAARSAQQDYEADNCVNMADDATPEDWQVVKLRIWARQWRASKLAPKKYGDKVTLAGDEENPLMFQKIERVVVGAKDATD